MRPVDDPERTRRAVRFADTVDAVALYLASEPESVRRAVVRHLHDEDGGCTGCGSDTPWPCIVAHGARRAEELLADRALARSRRGTEPQVERRTGAAVPRSAPEHRGSMSRGRGAQP